jgi:hypothetical protein
VKKNTADLEFYRNVALNKGKVNFDELTLKKPLITLLHYFSTCPKGPLSDEYFKLRLYYLPVMF